MALQIDQLSRYEIDQNGDYEVDQDGGDVPGGVAPSTGAIRSAIASPIRSAVGGSFSFDGEEE